MAHGDPAAGAPVTTILWRRLDVPGHDACRLESVAAGWRLEGAAVFLHEGVAARLLYEVLCDATWRTREGRVHGRIGERAVDLRIVRAPAAWLLNGVAAPDAGDVADLDYGFTPATNLLQVRRLALREGEGADAPAAWLDAVAGTLGLLRQRYERLDGTRYAYEAPAAPYAATLEVTPEGFVRRYPGLWEAVT